MVVNVMVGGGDKLQFGLCLSTYDNGMDPVRLFWYSFNPEDKRNQVADFFEGSPEVAKILPEGVSCASVGSKVYFFGGSKGRFGDINSRRVYCYDMCDKSLAHKDNMELPRYEPRLMLTSSPPPASMLNSSSYIYVVGSDLTHTFPLETLEPFVEVYDHNTDRWCRSTVKPLPSSFDSRGINDATIVEIDGHKKLLVTLAFHTLALDLQTNEWEDVTKRFHELRKHFSDTSPILYNGVWYVYDQRHKEMRGFDFHKHFWFTLQGFPQLRTFESYLFNTGGNNFCLVSSSKNPDYVTSSVFYVKFKINETVDGFIHADHVWESPSQIVSGTQFRHCFPIPLQLPSATNVRSLVGNVTQMGQACATDTGLPSSDPCRPLQGFSPLQLPSATNVRSLVGNVTQMGQACATDTGLPSSDPCRPLQGFSETGETLGQTERELSRKQKKRRRQNLRKNKGRMDGHLV